MSDEFMEWVNLLAGVWTLEIQVHHDFLEDLVLI
jgi:hypothetical protein